MFQTLLFQIVVDIPRFRLPKHLFFTPSCKHCLSAPFSDFATSHRKLFHFNILKGLVENTTEILVWNLHGQHEVKIWTVSSFLFLTKPCFLSFSGFKKVDLYLL